MNRRAFLAWLGGTAAGVAAASVLDVDKLLWMPGEKTFFIPEPKLVELTIGDVFTIQGVFARNPLTDAQTGFLQRFIITADVTSDGIIPAGLIHPRVNSDVSTRKIQPLLIGETVSVGRVEWKS